MEPESSTPQALTAAGRRKLGEEKRNWARVAQAIARVLGGA